MSAIQDELERLGIAVKFKFLPKSLSINKTEGMPSINWLVALFFKGEKVLIIEYSQSITHHPLWNPYISDEDAVILEKSIESGKFKGEPLKRPNQEDVFKHILDIAKVLEYKDYENWCEENDFDEDSYTGRTYYQEYIRISLLLKYYLSYPIILHLHQLFKQHYD